MSTIPPPIKGMKRIPSGLAMVGGADFVACVMATAQQPDALRQFTADTGMSLERVASATGIGKMIDEATGYQAAVIAAFADWVCEKLWGEEE